MTTTPRQRARADEPKDKKRTRRGRGEGSVFYDDSRERWVGCISMPAANGKRQRRKVTGVTKSEALNRMRVLQDQADKGLLSDAGGMTVRHYLAHWLEVAKSKVAPSTHVCYDRDVRLYLVPQLGSLRLGKLRPLHVEKMYADLAEDGVSTSMQRKAGVTLGVALQHAVSPAQLIPYNPASSVKKPRHEPVEMQVLDPDQVGLFLDAARADRFFAYYAVAIDSAARIGELFALTWADIDWKNPAVTVTRTLEEISGRLRVKDVKTKRSRRRIPLSQFATDALAEHRKKLLAEGLYKPDGIVFCDTLGGWLRRSNFLRNSFQLVWKRANETIAAEADEAGTTPALLPKIRQYDLRHTGATLLLLAGESPKVVSERLGHSSVVLTLDTYSHVLPGMQERAAAKIDAILRASMPKERGARS